MEGNTTVDGAVFIAFAEMPVHVGINEAEDEGLVAHECLVVALAVGDGALVGAAVGDFPEYGGGFPVFVSLLLDGLYPIVGHVHGHAVVEAVAAVLEGGCESGHTADFFGNGDGGGFDFVDEEVGKGKVADGVVVLVAVEVVAISAESFAEAVAVIEHGGDAVKAEAVEVELGEPVLAVGKEEVEHFVLAVVEAEAVPSAVFAAAARIEELVGVTSIVAEAFDFVLYGVAVDKVHNDSDACLMGCIYELLELVGGAEAAGGGEEGADMVTEAAVVGVLLDGHNLDAVEACVDE